MTHSSRVRNWTCRLLWLGGVLAALPAWALNPDDARHLLSRTGFGAAPAEVAALLPLDREQAVDRLLSQLRTTPRVPAPAFVAQPLRSYDADPMGYAARHETTLLQQWWLDEMVSTPSAMTERLVLFWHNHFVSQVAAQEVTAPMYDQLQLFRSQGSGKLRDLMRSVVRDPMMLTYLNNIENTREHPNENLARELMELFSLGTGHYTEDDVKALARVLTGHQVDRDKGWRYRFAPEHHDDAPVTFLGEPGVQDIDAAIDVILRQPAAAQFLAGKLAREYISVEPGEAEIDRLATVLRESDYDVKTTLRAMFTGEAFWSAQSRGGLVKSPVDLVVGFARTFGVTAPDAWSLAYYSASLGQSLMEPPNVAGWAGGLAWATTASLPRQREVVERLWDWYSVGKAYAARPRDKGLLIRLSNEYVHTQALVRVRINDKVVGDFRLSHGLDTSRASASDSVGYIKPAWEDIYLPEARLPSDVRQVSLELLDEPASASASVFVNWVQWRSERFNTRHAQRTHANESCNDPMGMMYCRERLEFDLTRLRAHTARAEYWAEEMVGDTNETIEYLTSLSPTRLQAAARSPAQLALAFDQELAGALPRSNAALAKQVLLPVAPMRPILPLPEAKLRWGLASPDMQQIQALTFDPAYLLK